MTEMLWAGNRQEPALRGTVDRGVADLTDEIVVAGDDKAACPRLPLKRRLDPAGGRFEGNRALHHPRTGQARVVRDGVAEETGPRQEAGHRSHLMPRMADEERGGGRWR
jgi:hypothetical protein